MRVSFLAAMLVALAAGTTLAGAQGLVPAGGLSIVSTRVRGTDQLTGMVLGGQGTVALGRLELAIDNPPAGTSPCAPLRVAPAARAAQANPSDASFIARSA